MIPPTSIDGTDITGATIDGTDVQEITVDGQTVFTAAPQINLPVAYSNLVAWYPFDSATYGGSNTDDVTAILGGSGDDTAFNLTLQGALTQSSGGVTDISAGANSGELDHSSSADYAESPLIIPDLGDFTVSLWIDLPSINQDDNVLFSSRPGAFPSDVPFMAIGTDRLNPNSFGGRYNFDGLNNPRPDIQISDNSFTNTSYFHFAMTVDDSATDLKCYINGNQITGTPGDIRGFGQNGVTRTNAGTKSEAATADIDDLRIYNTNLSQSQINQIFQNTQP